MTTWLSKLKDTPSFCFPFKIPDDPTAFNKYLCRGVYKPWGRSQRLCMQWMLHIYYSLVIVWRQLGYCLETAWQLSDNCLTTAVWLTDNCQFLTISWRMHKNCQMNTPASQLPNDCQEFAISLWPKFVYWILPYCTLNSELGNLTVPSTLS